MRIAGIVGPSLSGLYAGFVGGFAVAWLSMKITWLDMRFDTELFIPVGAALGLVFGVSALTRPVPRRAVPAAYSLLGLLATATVLSLAQDPGAAWHVAPIMVREAFGLSELDPPVFWTLFAVSSTAVLLRAGLGAGGRTPVSAASVYAYPGGATDETS